jgi:hypothetical protein
MLRRSTFGLIEFRTISGRVFRTATVILLLSLADAGFSQNVSVTETAWLRRFGYPVSASVEFRQGEVGAIDKVRLLNSDNTEVAAQFTAFSQWNDGSVRKCEIDFTTGIGPQESQSFRVEPGVGPQNPIPKGIEVRETDDSILVTSSSMQHQIRRDGRPLLASITYGSDEFLGKDGVTTSVKASDAKIIKRGPFNATIELGDVRLEYVSSKSWVKLTQRSESTDVVSVDGHLNLTSDPLLWDLGMGSWLYGTLHERQDAVELRKDSVLWRVVTSKPGRPPLLFATSSQFDGCGHFADRQRVAAFGIADCSSLDDPQIQLNGDGHIRLSAKCRELTAGIPQRK